MSDALEALQADTANEPAEWKFGGHVFTLTRKVDLRAVMLMQRGDFNRAIGLVLGPEQTDTLLELDTDEALDDDAMKDLMDTWARANGSTMGESSASTDS